MAIVNVPHEEEYNYVNRKGFHSINVQIINDFDLCILNVNARYPGSCHDSHIFESSLAVDVMKNLSAADNQTWLLGDSAYQLQNFIMTPFRQPNNPNEVLFNKVHSKIRNAAERCIGVLKGRFRCLTKARALHYEHKWAGYIIYGVCVCHNFLIKHKYPIQDVDIYDEETEIPADNDGDHQIHDRDGSENRQFLMNYIIDNNIN